MKRHLLFDNSTKPFIYEALNITIGDDGFLYKDGVLLLDMFDNKPVTDNEFGGISRNGIFKVDLHSLMNLVKENNVC